MIEVYKDLLGFFKDNPLPCNKLHANNIDKYCLLHGIVVASTAVGLPIELRIWQQKTKTSH